MPPRVFTEEEREKLRISMLEQAIPLLEEYGLVHMSVDKITKKVGIGKSTFYNFFSSKEEYVSYALEYNRKKVLDELDKKFPPGKKMKPAEVFQMWFTTLLSSNSIYKKFSAEDERALYEADKARGKEVSLARETYVAERLMVHMEGVRANLDVALLANYIKLIVLAYENSYMFHDSAMERMQDELKIRLIDLIFEEDAKAELIEMLKAAESYKKSENRK
ncbi:MAG: TetR/AcrR family transcriptional regulator [Eubacterium sp.]|nr:TetR/AcrR family transcriptional regulator [Eubacterium sp.]